MQFFCLSALSPITTFPSIFKILAKTFEVADSLSSPSPLQTKTLLTSFLATIPALKHFLFLLL
ncbi:hypothetical protein [Caminibacter mediatlanticus]|uniref:Uncharacterized protein n=1 Tax=Caminibacter mediatlanticus TB-2 TaxID=391592 RepID=A0AAI9AGU9_9BACT|nr:hypothetical protein [Caminibacter mediatlanticus]EDM23365.1 hypothetical protein CMTB2_08875 [Caminibacter mediatlanticus TB-2]